MSTTSGLSWVPGKLPDKSIPLETTVAKENGFEVEQLKAEESNLIYPIPGADPISGFHTGLVTGRSRPLIIQALNAKT